MKLALAFIAALVLAATPVSAAQWKVDRGKSRLGFTVQWSGEALNAVFRSWTANISFDPADLAHAKAVVTIDLTSEDSGASENDDGLKGAEGFAIDRFPSATFETTGFTPGKNGNAYVANGRLSLHGMTRTLALPFILTISGNTAHMVGRAVVSRIDFGLGTGEWAGETPVAHAVTITVDLTATKAS